MNRPEKRTVQINARVSPRQEGYLRALAERMGSKSTSEVLRCAIDGHELISRLAILSDPIRQAWLREQTDGLLGLRETTAEGLGRVWVADLARLWGEAFPGLDLDRLLEFLAASRDAGKEAA